MALSPSIPTSFVPKQPVTPGPKRPRSTGVNLLVLLSTVVIVAGTVIVTAGVFLYSLYLGSQLTQSGNELVTAQKNISQNRVSDFVRLSNRLTASKTILNQHVALSQFFTLLESITISQVSYKSLDVKVADDRTATIVLTGTAADFNALAAESNAFAGEKQIKSAIFSGITVNADGTVAFTVNASLDPSIIVQLSAPQVLPPSVVATSTPLTIPSTPSVRTASGTAATTTTTP